MNKSSMIQLRATPAKKAEWERAAAANQMKLSSFITAAGDAAAGGPPFLRAEEVDALHGLHDQLRRAGTNLNTLLRELHAANLGRAKVAPNSADFEQVHDELHQALATVSDFLGTKV